MDELIIQGLSSTEVFKYEMAFTGSQIQEDLQNNSTI